MLGLLSCLGLLVCHNVHLAAAVGIGVLWIMRVASVTHQGDARVRRAGCTRRGSWNQAGTPAGFEVGLPNSPATMQTREKQKQKRGLSEQRTRAMQVRGGTLSTVAKTSFELLAGLSVRLVAAT